MLVIHLGMSRTGRGSLQDFCRRNQPALNARGWAVADPAGSPDSDDVSRIAQHLDKARYVDAPGKLNTQIEALGARLAHCPSANLLLWSDWPSIKEAAFWKALERICASTGRKLLLLVYLREQRSWLLSAYAERVIVGGRSAAAARFVQKSQRNTDLDYLASYQWLRETVGASRLAFRRYQRARDICADFLRVLTLPSTGWTFPEQRINASPGVIKLELVRALNDLSSVSGLSQPVRARLTAASDLDGDRHLYRLVPPSLLAAVAEKYRETNEALAGLLDPRASQPLFDDAFPEDYLPYSAEERINASSIELLVRCQVDPTTTVASSAAQDEAGSCDESVVVESAPDIALSLPAAATMLDVPSAFSPNLPTRLGEETALIFVINRKYIRPLKVLLYSLRQQGSLLDCPIEIVTDDLVVANDPFITKVARNVEYLAPEQLVEFNTIRGDRIREASRTDFAPKYTFLKFIAFRERGYRRHIFIDADMLCLNPVDEALLARPYDVKAMIEVGAKLFPIRDESRAGFNFEKSLGYVVNASTPREQLPGRSINSGFMVFESKAISNGVFELAIDVASTEAFGAEQPATTEVIRRIPGCRFLEIPIWYNTRRRVLECMGEDFFNENKKNIVLLHYTPGKPWILGDRTPDYLDRLWLEWELESLPWVTQILQGGGRRANAG